MPKVVIIAGPPCSGKGTQCKRIAADRGLVHISTGDVLRDEVARGTELGLAAKPFLDASAFVPDELVIGCEEFTSNLPLMPLALGSPALTPSLCCRHRRSAERAGRARPRCAP